MLKLPRSCSDDVAFHIGATPAAIKELARKETLKELADDGVGLNDAADVIAAKYSWISSRVEIMASPVSPRAKCLCRLKYLATFQFPD